MIDIHTHIITVWGGKEALTEWETGKKNGWIEDR